jgi:hypothetical protein
MLEEYQQYCKEYFWLAPAVLYEKLCNCTCHHHIFVAVLRCHCAGGRQHRDESTSGTLHSAWVSSTSEKIIQYDIWDCHRGDVFRSLSSGMGRHAFCYTRTSVSETYCASFRKTDGSYWKRVLTKIWFLSTRLNGVTPPETEILRSRWYVTKFTLRYIRLVHCWCHLEGLVAERKVLYQLQRLFGVEWCERTLCERRNSRNILLIPLAVARTCLVNPATLLRVTSDIRHEFFSNINHKVTT